MRNSIDDNFYISGKDSHYYVVIPVNSWVGSKNCEGSLLYRNGKSYIDWHQCKVVDFYAQLDEKDIEFASMVDINSAEIDEVIFLPGIGKKQ